MTKEKEFESINNKSKPKDLSDSFINFDQEFVILDKENDLENKLAGYSQKTAEIADEVKNLTFDQEIENDIQMSKYYQDKCKDSSDPLEKAGLGVYQRALMLTAFGDMKIKQEKEEYLASEVKLPNASYLSHGARTVVQIPKGTGDQLFNWITSGDKNTNGASVAKSQEEAAQKEKYVFNRSAATHGISVSEDGIVREEKGMYYGAESAVVSNLAWASNAALGFFGMKSETLEKAEITPHYGINLSIGLPKSEKIDKNHGHFYMCYYAPTETQNGGLLFGIEGAAPDSPDHSLLGNPDLYSPTYGSNWDKLSPKLDKPGCEKYQNAIIGDKYNGRKITLSPESLEAIISAKLSHEQIVDLADKIPLNNQKQIEQALTSPQKSNKQGKIEKDKITPPHSPFSSRGKAKKESQSR